MTRSRELALAALAFAALAIAPDARAGTLEGSVTFPGRTVPGSTVYARNVESGVLHRVSLRRGERSFRLELPAGRYWLFMRPQEPGLAELYGAHTRFSTCRTQPNANEGTCTDHSLLVVEIPESGTLAGIGIDDWFLEEAQAEALDQVLGAAPNAVEEPIELGRPRFSEYRAAAWQSADRPRLEPDERIAAWREQLEAAAEAGANFAGRFAVARVECGPDCRQVAIVDVASGTVTLPEQLPRTPTTLPCRTERELVFRDDSRLLEHTHRDGAAVITDYLLWDVARRTFTTLAQYRRSLERFCGSTPQ